MATIESLDLATLTNNPQSIAEALEDVLEVSSGNIASLKQTAENDANHITNTLKPQAQADADTLTQLVNNAPTADVLNKDFSVIDISSHIVPRANIALHSLEAYTFLDFVFISVEIENTGSPQNHSIYTLFEITATSIRPKNTSHMPAIGYQGDSCEYVKFQTNGNVDAYHSTNPGHASWIATINGFFRIV